uniref:Uncharacterized protein n=1 Tax=Anguilla anguilla TaxID=7936 RepID=A0A0E9X8Y7_ANGAN
MSKKDPILIYNSLRCAVWSGPAMRRTLLRSLALWSLCVHDSVLQVELIKG